MRVLPFIVMVFRLVQAHARNWGGVQSRKKGLSRLTSQKAEAAKAKTWSPLEFRGFPVTEKTYLFGAPCHVFFLWLIEEVRLFGPQVGFRNLEAPEPEIHEAQTPRA